MIKIVCIIKPACPACQVAVKSITNAIDYVECDMVLKVRHKSNSVDEAYNVTKYPTTVIYKNDKDGNKSREIARLEGSFPSDYITEIINKLQKE